MTTTKPYEQHNSIADRAAQSADHAIKSTQRKANDALDGLADTVEDIRHETAPMLNRASERASALAQRGVDAVRKGSGKLRDQAQRASEGTVSYIKDEPVKAILIAAAVGAALMATAGLLGRSRRRSAGAAGAE